MTDVIRKEEIENRLDAIEDDIATYEDVISRLEDERDRLEKEYEAIEQAEIDDPEEPEEPFSLIAYPHFVGCNCGWCPAWSEKLTRPVSALEPLSA